MLTPLSMQRIFINTLVEHVPLIAQVLAECGVFNPEIPDKSITENLPELLGQNFRNVFVSARNRLDKIIARNPIFLLPNAADVNEPVELATLERINTQLGDIWQHFSKLDDQLHHIREQQTHLKQLFEILKKFSVLDLDLGLFQKPKQFLNIHIGTIPLSNLAHLRESVALAEHLIRIFHRDDTMAYLIVAGTLSHQEQVRSILEHAEFRPLTIPPEFRDRPQQVHTDLTAQANSLQQDSENIIAQQQAFFKLHQTTIQNAYQILNQTAAYAKLTDTVKSRGHLAIVTGWIPQTDLPRLRELLDNRLTCPYVLTHRNPLPEERDQVPSLMRHHPLLKPFMALVKNYGIPRYGEFDPTLLFAVSFLVMFGMMFGDVGHGIVIAGAGWYLRSYLKEYAIFFMGAGLLSLFFGLLYGSFFGFEELLPALWLSPIHEPTAMLTVALYWGIGFILLATLIAVINRWRSGEYGAALFDNSGVAGILMFLGGFYAIKQWMLTGTFDAVQQGAIGLPLLVILGYKWHENQMPSGERLLVTLIEGFESIIKYFANTLSFLRVAAFSLNHAALAIAVFTLANMMDTTGYTLMIIFGNLFIIGFEGAIVMIQILRLEYYEGFSRFFRGDGRAFCPLMMGLK